MTQPKSSAAAPVTSRGGSRDNQTPAASQHPHGNTGIADGYRPMTRAERHKLASMINDDRRWCDSTEILDPDAGLIRIRVPRRRGVPDLQSREMGAVGWTLLRADVGRRWPGAILACVPVADGFAVLAVLELGGETTAVQPLGFDVEIPVAVAVALARVWTHGLPDLPAAVACAAAEMRGEVADA